MVSNDDLLVCSTCGTQFDESDPKALTSCKICDDPRQFVPPTGQSFTTLHALKPTHTTVHIPIPLPPSSPYTLTSVTSSPKIGIGQRAILIQSPNGNILWDCITLLDAPTIAWINSLGGLSAVVISHPHYYSTHNLWGETFNCPVYLSREDEEWTSRADVGKLRRFIEVGTTEVKIPGKEGADTGVKAIKLGGHFPGSLVVLVGDEQLLVADTLMTTPAGLGNWAEGTGMGRERPKGMNSFSFMWSIPNMIPLGPEHIAKMWSVLKEYKFTSTHGAFVGTDIFSKDIKERVLESMKIQIRNEGYADHKLLYEGLEESS